MDRASMLYRGAIVVDVTAPIAPYADIETAVTPEARVGAYLEAGISLAIFTVVDDFPNSIERTIKLLAANRRFILSRPELYRLATCTEEIRSAKRQGQLAVAFAFQGTNALLGDLSLVEVYRRLGVIQMLLAYNVGNLAADGCHEPRNAGLTDFGRTLVVEMNRVGVIVDVTHLGTRSSLEALELTHKPPIFSHSTPKKFAQHDRNITDEQIQACAAKNGVVCLSGVGLFMDADGGMATARKLTDTIDYVAQLVGPMHAGIGLDYIADPDCMARYLRANAAFYGAGQQYPSDGLINFLAPGALQEVADGLLRKGYAEKDVRGILGENYLRVLEENTRIEGGGSHV